MPRSDFESALIEKAVLPRIYRTTPGLKAHSPFGARRKVRSRLRSGIATVELAICLPVLTLIVFGSIQATNLIFLQHAATAAAYEGSLEMAKSNATNVSVRARIQQVLDARGIVNSTIAILPAGTAISRTPTGTLLTLQVTADTRSNTTVFDFFTMQNQVTASLVASR